MLAIQPASAGDEEHAERQGQPAKHLHHAELAIDLVLIAWRAVGVVAVDDLGAHGVGETSWITTPRTLAKAPSR